jgi:NAD(P)-dependent dehydrogenase (short-subunit alcohol dehydrogenase family)
MEPRARNRAGRQGEGPLLRDGLLEGRVVAIAVSPGTEGSAEARDTARRCAELGASVPWLPLCAAQEVGAETAVAAALSEHGRIDALVGDGLGAFAAALAASDAGESALRACLDGAWNVSRAVANAAFIPDARGGKIVYVAPAAEPGAHPGREAARAGLENMARTLSIEWARYAVRITTILPGAATAGEAVADLVAFLASPAGDYYSGCRFELDTLAAD